MNLVTNTQSLINVMNSVTAADTNCDLNTLYYNIGRIVRYILVFSPVTSAPLNEEQTVMTARDFLNDAFGDSNVKFIDHFSQISSNLGT